MRVNVRNFRGAAEASFPLEKIVLVGGNNAAGKSSLAQAIGAALTGSAVPIRGVKKNEAGVLVRAGSADGSAAIEGAEGSVAVAWPSAKVKTDGAPPVATVFAAGLSSLIHLADKDQAPLLAEYLGSNPTRADLEKALAGEDLKTEHIDQMWQVIEAQGWDGAHKGAKEKGAKLKGQWEEITGDRYGKKKAESWVPEQWEPDLDGESEEALQSAVTAARDALEGAIAAEAIDDNAAAELERLAAEIPALEEAKGAALIVRDEVAESLEIAVADLAALPEAKQAHALTCPHCQKAVAMTRGELTPAAEPLPAAEIEARQKAIDEARETVATAQKSAQAAERAVSGATSKLEEALAAERELAAQPEKPTGAGEVDACRNALQEAEGRLDAWQRKTAADNRHMNIGVNARIADALAPGGLRQTVLAKALKVFNSEAADLASAAGWPHVALDDELVARYGGTPYALLSKSERFRVRVVLQVVMAKRDKSAAVLIDGADILADRQHRNGLFGMLAAEGLPAVVTMAFAAPDDMPNIDAAGIGRAYWIDAGGILRPRAEAVTE